MPSKPHLHHHLDSPLTPHGVTLVRHGAGPNLTLLERLLDLLVAGQEANVRTDLVGGGSETGQDREDVQVHLAAVSLTRHCERPVETQNG